MNFNKPQRGEDQIERKRKKCPFGSEPKIRNDKITKYILLYYRPDHINVPSAFPSLRARRNRTADFVPYSTYQ